MDSIEMEMQDKEENMDVPVEDMGLPPGIKTEVVLSFLGNISQALTDISNGINQTITTIVTEGTKPMDINEGETNEEQD